MKILFVAMPNSVHAARWVNQLRDEQWNIHLFPIDESPLHSEFKNITVHPLFRHKGLNHNSNISQSGFWWPFERGRTRFEKALENISPKRVSRSARLVRKIRYLKPDIVHCLEVQHAGYLTLEAKNYLGKKFPTWIVSNWGSDIYLFGRISKHREKIKKVLSECDYYASECHRDMKLAWEYGFKGEVLPVLPNAGGYDLDLLRSFRQPGATSERRLILLKGYQGWAGRALVGLRALELSAKYLKGYKVVIYLAGEEVEIAAELVSSSIGVPVDIIPYSSHEDILRLHGKARLSIGLSISDAISTSLLEAMIMGSFPIQSHTSCASEWVKNGETGFLVHPEDPKEIANAIKKAITDDFLVNQAAAKNAKTAVERLDYWILKKKVVEIYRNVLNASKSRKEQ